jgi:FkbM family methyltransferase
LNDFALSDNVGTVSFRAIDTDRSETVHLDGNPGASSLFLASKDYTREKYVQKEISVPSNTLDVYCINASRPDLLWMDLQGAELMVLKGADCILSDVKCIHIEIGFRPMYVGQPLFFEIDRFLKNRGFELIDIDLGRWPRLLRLYKFFHFGPWIGNAIYINKKCLS